MRKERKEISAENRYEVVNLSRSVNEFKNNTDINYDLVDLQKKNQEENTQYAYDLYIAAKQDFDVSMLDDIVSIENYETNLIFGSHRDNGRRTPSSNSDDQDSDDSNDENNWRNEYPDTENSSIDEEDMAHAMERCDLDDLSSDTGEDKIYDDPPDLFSADANHYGIEYAKYKARVLADDPENKNKGLIYYSKSKDFEEKSLKYKDDSDDGFYYGQEEDTEQFREQYRFDHNSDERDSD
ncbi:hypothetical protein EVAR_98959_1 [Eumeta japonica]|uniref:Probable RNA polymerase II nuclear localization protein SLC7A6OS n=1 Tax=Eumeta variegata TaxID=151549 RepID=A0A4C1YMP4_EUMVA|nr:hypothetical protein EVAR_98959_1 [Eumeta japonica]